VLDGVRTLVKSPGVRPENEVLTEAIRRGLEVVDEIDVGWRLVPAPTVGVTGTKGKSTTSSLCVALLAAHGLAPALAGNTEYGPPLSELALGEPPRSVVAEVSSFQALYSQELAVDAAVFTNLTPEHLGWHGGMEAYADAKRKLFVRGEWCAPLASLNVDDRLGREMAREVGARGGRVLTYGTAEEAAYRIVDCRWDLREAAVSVETPDGLVEMRTRLPGRHNAANATAVLALGDGLGLPREPTLEALAAAEPVPGRFEVLDLDRPFDVVVDLGFTVDAVDKALSTARELTAARGGRLLTVLSIIGRSGPVIGREVGTRARQLSDHLFLCGSSYRGEPRLPTLAELAVGARGAEGGSLETIIDRSEAVARALAEARPGDVVMLVGRGPLAPEATDIRGGFRDLSDRRIVEELL
ncbi:MAG TPA: Mur ligase family protein, partial [Solirubrobacterales bacterium]|nr:Mur ligase family protein [Solirubrobacterales bacterium]